MKARKIIPCLDFKDGHVVKGVNFIHIKEAGDPVLLAGKYSAEGADEIAFLDIAATDEGRKTLLNAVRNTAKAVSVPLTVGGGITSLDDIRAILAAGASKVSINTAAVKNPSLIAEAAAEFGSGRIVVAIDGLRIDGGMRVMTGGGRQDSGISIADWAGEAERLGAGAILLTSIDADGAKTGYDIEMTRLVTDAVNIDVIASGGCGSMEDILLVFKQTGASAALAASVFHFGEITVGGVKEYLKEHGIPVF